MSIKIDDKLVDKYCFFSGDFNKCHLKQSQSSNKKRIIHGGLLCDYSIKNNNYLKTKNIKRLKITFQNILSIPANLKTKIVKKKKWNTNFLSLTKVMKLLIIKLILVPKIST